MEKWKTITGYEGFYAVSDLGRVKSYQSATPKILSTRVNKNGYEMVGLHVKGTRKMCYVHRLVADAFLGACPKDCEVDHINRIRTDNRLSNLRHLSKKVNHAQAKESKRRGVRQYTLTGKFICEYPSRTDAADATGISRRNICSVALGRRRQAGGYIWRDIATED